MALSQHYYTFVAVVLLLLGSGCSQTSQPAATAIPSGPVSRAFITAQPEAHLLYPDAQVLRPFGNGEQANPIEGGANSAFAGAVFSTTDPPEQIYAWYDQWLTTHGWQPAQFARAMTFRSLQGYRRGTREAFYIAIDDPVLLARTLGTPIPADKTVAEQSYQIAPSQ